MFPLVHIYTAVEVSGKKSPQLVIGSLISDVGWVDREKFPVVKLHDEPTDFRSFIFSKYPDYTDLADGMMLHSSKLGADKYVHTYNGGFAIVKGKEVVPDLSKILINLDEGKYLNIAHSFIEAALDLLLKDRNQLIDLYRKSLEEVDMDEISKIIAEYSKLETEYVRNMIDKMFLLLNPESLRTEDSIAGIMKKYTEVFYQQKLEINDSGAILKKSIEVSRKDSDKLFEMMISLMKKDISGSI